LLRLRCSQHGVLFRAKRLTPFRLIAIVSFGFALSILSNTLEPAVLSHKVLELAAAYRNTALGLTTFFGMLVASVVQPTVGVLSDRTRSRLGRRLPYLIGGAFVVISCLYLIALSASFASFVGLVVLLQAAANVVQGPWQALISDLVPEARRGLASGAKAMSEIVGLIVGRQIAGQLLGHHPEWGPVATVAAVSVPTLAFLLALVLTLLGAREGPNAPGQQSAQPSLRQALSRTFAVDLRSHPDFAWWFVNRLLFWAAFIALGTFLLFFVIDVVGIPEAPAQWLIGRLSALLGTAIALVTVPSGKLADRFGAKPLVVLSGLIAALGGGIMILARDMTTLIVAGALVGLGVGMFLSSSWTFATEMVPPGQAGRYLGIANIATTTGSASGRLLGGILIDSLNRTFGSVSIGYLSVYGLAALFFLLSALAATRLPTRVRA